MGDTQDKTRKRLKGVLLGALGYLNFFFVSSLERMCFEKERKPRVSRRKEITKIRAELNNIGTKTTIQRINKYRSWLFEKINKIEKALSRFIKKKRERTQINKIRNER